MEHIFYGYARKSTEEQNVTSFEVQLETLEETAKDNSMKFIGISETGSGTTLDNRIKLKELLDKLQDGDALGVYDSSRLTRDVFDGLRIVDQVKAHNAMLFMDGREIDLNNPQEILQLNLNNSINSYNVQMQKQKSLAGMKRKKENGNWIFSNRLLGYNIVGRNKKVKIEIVDSEAIIVKYIYDEYLKGLSLRKITQILNKQGHRTKEDKIFRVTTVRRILNNPLYKGYYPVVSNHKETVTSESKLIKSNYYQPIISEDIWNQALYSYRFIRRTNAPYFKYNYASYELSSLIHCKNCEELGKKSTFVHSYRKRLNKNPVEYYALNQHVEGCCCHRYTFKTESIEKVFRSCFFMFFMYSNELSSYVIEKKDLIEKLSKDINKRTSELAIKKKEIKKQKSKLYNFIIKVGEDEESEIAMNSLNKELLQIESAIQNLKYAFLENEEAYNEAIATYTEDTLVAYLLTDIASNKRNIYLNMIESAYVYPDNSLEIKFKNNKSFRVDTGPTRRGPTFLSEYLVDVFYNGQFQYRANIDTKNDKVEIADYMEEERIERINKLKNQREPFKSTLIGSPVEKARTALLKIENKITEIENNKVVN